MAERMIDRVGLIVKPMRNGSLSNTRVYISISIDGRARNSSSHPPVSNSLVRNAHK